MIQILTYRAYFRHRKGTAYLDANTDKSRRVWNITEVWLFGFILLWRHARKGA